VIDTVHELGPKIGIVAACTALAMNRAFVYRNRARRLRSGSGSMPRHRPRPPLSLSGAEQAVLLGVLDSERFMDVAPASIYATLLDEGRYHGSIRTMYRLLAAQNQGGERRHQRVHPLYTKPELLAIRPNEVWSWDITKLRGPAKWTCFHLYVILDIFSRYVVGWMIAQREAAELAEQLIADTVAKQNIVPGTLTLHADRGTSMRSKPVAALLVDLDVAKSHSRPHVSDDNPYSESQFKTLKYRPDFPERFGSIEDARAHCQQFFYWYNTVHRHSGIGLMPPEIIHYGRADALTAERAVTLEAAFTANPLRFKRKMPKPPALPTAAWINPPQHHPSAVESGQENNPTVQIAGVPEPRVTLRSPLLDLPMHSPVVANPENLSFRPLPTENSKHHTTCPLIS
jgi:putative transposase